MLYGKIVSFEMSAIASDCFISVKSIVEKHGLSTGESTWIERKMVPGFLGEVLS
jgi:hypothetical protein